MASTLQPGTILVCGEALIDLLPGPQAHTWRSVCGGGPANTAVALSRLGTPAAFVGRLSADAFGRQLRDNLVAESVDLSLAVAATQPTTLAVVRFDEHGAAGYDFYLDGTADWQWTAQELPATLPASVAGLHIGSLATVVPPGAAVLLDWAKALRATVSITYDINVRPRLLPDQAEYVRRVEGWLDTADQVKASDDDLRWLYPSTDPLDVARSWVRTRDIRLVLLTSGADGAIAITANGEIHAPGFPVAVVDTVGAGDSFTAAYLHFSKAHGDDDAGVEQALRYATAAAAVTCTRPGAQPPTADEVEALIASG
jgi:fructokinase